MISRRNLILRVGSALLCSPTVMGATSLMPVRSYILTPEPIHFGFATRLYVGSYLPQITKLRDAGSSLNSIALAFNARGGRAINGGKWDADHVSALIRLGRQIRRSDELLHEKRALAAMANLSGPASLVSDANRTPIPA